MATCDQLMLTMPLARGVRVGRDGQTLPAFAGKLRARDLRWTAVDPLAHPSLQRAVGFGTRVKWSSLKSWLGVCLRKRAKVLTIPPTRTPEREALVNISWSQVAIQPPVNGTALHMTEVKASLVRVWEPEPPQAVEALEWILVTSVTVTCAQDAWQRVTWYKWVRHEVVHVAVERENDDSTRCSAIVPYQDMQQKYSTV